MAHVKTKDPFGFVGSHVIHQRGSAATVGTASSRAGSFSGFGGATSSSTTTAAGEDSDVPEEHGWITRYDTRLDSYTLFIPGKGASVHSRGDVMKLIADPSFLIQNDDDDDDDEFPAPIEDQTSRYVDVPMRKAAVGLGASGASSANVNGVVKCYLPFADVYKVIYEDGTSDEVSEDTIINSMIFMLTSQKDASTASEPVPVAAKLSPAVAANSENSKKRKRGVDALALPTPAPMSMSHAMLTTPPATVRSVSAPVVSVTVPPPSMMPVSYAAALGMDSSPVVTHSNILELVAARNNSINGNSSSTPAAAPAQVAAIPTPALPTPRIPPLAPVPAAKPFIKNEPSSYSRNSSNSRDNIIMLIDDEPNIEMIPLDTEADVIVPVASSSLSASSTPYPDSWDFGSSDSWPMSAASSKQPPPSYLITEEPSQVMEPLETRNLAYKYVREELLTLLDRKEASAKKIAMQYDILRNPDIKNISSIKRFTEASGLVVLNHLISTYLAEHEYKSRDADVLLLLKVVAMLPMPARKHVADSKIALTIGKLAKPRSHELYPKLPLAITHLAKWIKRKWTEHFSKQENQEKTQQRSSASSSSKSGQPSQRLGTRTAPPGSAGQRSSNPIGIPDRLVDTQPIPRLASRPALAGPPDAVARPTTDVMGNPIGVRSSNLSLPLSNGGTSASRKSSLRPDWMRQQEALRRTRFTSEDSQDSTAEYNHYKRIRRTGPSSSSAQPLTGNSSNSSGSSGNNYAGSASSTNNSLYFVENEQPESAGGSRGTFGRNQKLSFGSRWSVVEFHRDAPPSSVRPTNRHQHQAPRHVRPRSILRRESKYKGTLDSIR